jgi:hypothetical protein
MGLKVAYMSDEAIEKDAQALLADYARERGVPIEAPIPIEDIIEKHLKIGIEFDDTHRLFGVPRSGIGFDPDILGAIFFDQSRFLRCSGYELQGLRAEGPRKVFVFRDRASRRDDVMAFYGDATSVRPLAFAATIKDMKGLLHNG